MQNLPNWLLKLNPQQREAVETTDGALLILSGAGTGKTRVLVSKIAYLIANGCARPWEILALTFTNKAANEMKTRARNMIGEEADSLWAGTFHSIGLKILKKYPMLAGIAPNFLIYGEDDQKNIIKKIMEDDLDIDIKKWPPTAVMEGIARLKDKGVSIDGEASLVEKEQFGGRLMEIYRLYQKKLIELNGVDFGDLLLYPLIIFNKNPDVLKEYQDKFKYILVDEYQDTNKVQYQLLKLLYEGHKNIACVGDDDQSIYSWRGADIDNILRFEQDFKEAKIIRLETNYRSTPHILAAASGLISFNQGRLGKTLRPCEALAGEDVVAEKVYVRRYGDGLDEVRNILNEIEWRQMKKISLSEMAILVRAGYLTRQFEKKLKSRGITYKIIGDISFYERQEIKDSIAYLRLLLYPRDDLSFERIINVPKRGVGDKALADIYNIARREGKSMLEATKIAVATGVLKGKALEQLRIFIDSFDSWKAELDGAEKNERFNLALLARRVFEESGYIDMWRNSKKEEAEARRQNIMELISDLSEYETLSEFIEYTSLFTENNEAKIEGEEYLSIMTLHAAKGLEFDIVFLPVWEQGRFPNEKAMDEGQEEEERRLAYVGITRAKKAAFVSYAASRIIFTQEERCTPSVFIGNLRDRAKENIDELRL
ncbi:MAG: UvrD-helicase domain-containing protein [Alphaproteobacteria bacterium]|nr:UvrD-helicase domain-containing protein [Alphaproteobacteria bacterium]